MSLDYIIIRIISLIAFITAFYWYMVYTGKPIEEKKRRKPLK